MLESVRISFSMMTVLCTVAVSVSPFSSPHLTNDFMCAKEFTGEHSEQVKNGRKLKMVDEVVEERYSTRCASVFFFVFHSVVRLLQFAAGGEVN